MPLPTWVSSLCKLCSRFLVGSDERAAARRRSSSCWISVGSSSNRITSVQTIWSSRSWRTMRLSHTGPPSFRQLSEPMRPRLCTRPIEPQIRVPNPADRRVRSPGGRYSLCESTAECQCRGSVAGSVPGHDRRVRAGAVILERSRRGKRHRARCGEVSVLSGAPYGYRYIRKTDEAPASYVVIDAEARVVQQVYESYTVAGWSIGAITRWLNDHGVATRKPGARWERSMVWAMLRNPAYRGTACFGKTRVA